MAGRVFTREFYDSLLAAFRECPGNATHAARRAICDRRAARRAWSSGWPQYPWAKPIKLVLESESNDAAAAQRKAVLAAQDAAEAQREAARQERVEALKQEQQILKVARGDVLAALVLAADLVQAMRAAVSAVKEGLKLGPNGEPPVISPLQAMNLLTRHALLIQKAVGAAEAVIQLSRLDRGASTMNVAVNASEEDMSPEAIEEELEAIAEVLGAARGVDRAPRALPAAR